MPEPLVIADFNEGPEELDALMVLCKDLLVLAELLGPDVIPVAVGVRDGRPVLDVFFKEQKGICTLWESRSPTVAHPKRVLYSADFNPSPLVETICRTTSGIVYLLLI